MKINIKSITLIFAFLVFVTSGCGGADEKSNEKVNGSQNEVSQKEVTNNPDKSQNKENKQDGLVRILEQNLTYKEDGNQKEETAFLKKSENQNFSMYILPNFELSAEEPQKDILYLKENDSIFMRIELLPDEIDWDNLKETTSSQLSEVSTNIQTQTSQESDLFKDAIILEARNEEDLVIAYLINHQDMKLKITLFTNVNEDHREAFIQMAKTIMKESPNNE